MHYLKDFEKCNVRLDGKTRIREFLLFASRTETPVLEWEDLFQKCEMQFLKGLSESSRRIYRSAFRRFFAYAVKCYTDEKKGRKQERSTTVIYDTPFDFFDRVRRGGINK